MTRFDLDTARHVANLPEWLTCETTTLTGQRLRNEWARPVRPGDGSSGQARLAAAMLMLHGERPKSPLFAQANSRALRWVDARAKASRAARALAKAQPDLPWTLRLMGLTSRLTTPIMTACVLLICKSHILSIFEMTGRVASRLSQAYSDRNFGPMA